MIFKVKKIQDEDIEKLLDSIEPKIRKAFITFILSLRDQALVDQITELLNNGQIPEAINLIEKQVSTFSSKVLSFYTLAGAVASESLSSLTGVYISFNQVNIRAVEAMQRTRLRLITEFTKEQEKALRDLLVQGIYTGTNPKVTASQVKQILGLTKRQMDAVNNYRRLLEQNSVEALNRQLRDRRFDPSVENAINTNTALTKDQIERMVDRYAERQLAFRADTVARTESLRVVNQASQESLQQAVDNGDLEHGEVIQTWITAGDERVRSSHAAMHGQQRQLGETFISGNGNELAYPGDPDAPAQEVVRCRCVLTFRLTDLFKRRK